MHYRNASPRWWGLNVGLKVQRGVEIAAGVPIASALDSVHADRHRAVLVRLHRLEGVRKPALRLAAFARPALKLATYLQQERTRMAWALYLWEHFYFILLILPSFLIYFSISFPFLSFPFLSFPFLSFPSQSFPPLYSLIESNTNMDIYILFL
jgi:hypothetical protein